MCNEENHTNLSQTEHFTRHTMAVEQVRAMARSGIRSLAPDAGVADAREALKLADDGVARECIESLHAFLRGNAAPVNPAS